MAAYHQYPIPKIKFSEVLKDGFKYYVKGAKHYVPEFVLKKWNGFWVTILAILGFFFLVGFAMEAHREELNQNMATADNETPYGPDIGLAGLIVSISPIVLICVLIFVPTIAMIYHSRNPIRNLVSTFGVYIIVLGSVASMAFFFVLLLIG